MPCARIVIIGGGPGGYEAALVAAQLGAQVTVVDRDGLGGACVLTDCVPSKTLIATSEMMAALAGSADKVRPALEAADSVRDFDRRRAELQRVEETLRGTHVLVPLARLPLPLGARSGVHGLRATASGTLLLENAWVEP